MEFQYPCRHQKQYDKQSLFIFNFYYIIHKKIYFSVLM
jgi:hypothetical protein